MSYGDLEDDYKRIRALRNYYRKNFKNGESDESFLTWIETSLAEMEVEKRKEQ